MSTEPFLGQIKLFGFTFAPRGHAFCAGQLLDIGTNSALFSLLGTTYGGDGRTTFGLPDLRGRAAVNFGQGPGLSNYFQGEVVGEENHTLLSSEMPQHNHIAIASNVTADQTYPNNNLWANAASAPGFSNTSGVVMNAQSLTLVGNNLPHSNMQPYQVINYCIALVGIFPSRN